MDSCICERKVLHMADFATFSVRRAFRSTVGCIQTGRTTAIELHSACILPCGQTSHGDKFSIRRYRIAAPS